MSNTEDQCIDWLEKSISYGFIYHYEYSDFKDIKCLGRGSFGDVSLVTWKNTNGFFALKSFINDEQILKQAVREMKSHQSVSIHDNIIRFYGIASDTSAQTKKYSLVLEYADSGTLKTYLKKHFNELNWDDKYRLAYQLASAVECMHSRDIIHCDLHSKNILIHQKNIKLADFGLSKIAEESSNASKIHGIIPYIDPKSFDDKNYKLSKKSDVYSIGVLMWQISSGKQPFCDIDNDLSLCLNIKLNGKREDIIDGTPAAYSNLYKECWKYEPNERPEVQKVVSTLESIINGKSDKVFIDHEEIMDKFNSLNLKSGGTISSGLSGIINHDDCSLSNMKYKPDKRSEVQKVGSTLESIINGKNDKIVDHVNKEIIDQSNANLTPGITISSGVTMSNINPNEFTLRNMLNIVDISENSKNSVANKSDLKIVNNLIAEVTALTAQSVEAYKSAQYNKKPCAALIQRVQAAEVAVQALDLHKQENAKEFCQQTYYISFEKFVAILREIKEFIQGVTHLSDYKKFISSSAIKEKFQQLITGFDSVVGDLQLAMVIANEEERKKDISMAFSEITKNIATQAVSLDVAKILNEKTSSKLVFAKEILHAAINVGEAIIPFIPLIGVAATAIEEIINIYQTSQYNRKICSSLLDRARIAEISIDQLIRRRKDNEKSFKSQTWYKAFDRFVNVLNKLKDFGKKVSKLKGIKSFLKARDIKERFEILMTEYDTAMKDLNFTMAIDNEHQRRIDQKGVKDDLHEITQFLEKFDGDIEEIKNVLLIEQVENLSKSKHLEVKKIDKSQLTEPAVGKELDTRGSKQAPLKRKIYMNAIEVACKPVKISKDNDKYEKIQKIMAIHVKVTQSPNIIQFYGLSEMDGGTVMVLEWAELGNLKELYEKEKIPLELKLTYALHICRGIAYLNTLEICHHDLRCRNVVVTENNVAKLTNFGIDEHSKQLNFIGSIRWLAPEKLKDYEYHYDHKCEIYSFGMLLWELAFERIPYEKMEIDKVSDFVAKGNREEIKFDLASPEDTKIQKGFENIIREAWNQDPDIRISISKLLIDLDILSKSSVKSRSSASRRSYRY